MLWKFMLAGWKNMHPGEQYLEKYIDLYRHIEDKSYIKRTERFERWYENPFGLPGRCPRTLGRPGRTSTGGMGRNSRLAKRRPDQERRVPRAE